MFHPLILLSWERVNSQSTETLKEKVDDHLTVVLYTGIAQHELNIIDLNR